MPDPKPILLFPLLLLATRADAQSTELVLPARFAQAEGESFTGFPFGRSGSARVQLLFGGSLFTGRSTVSRLAFRADGGRSFSAKGVDLQIYVGTGPGRSSDLQADFARNRGSGFQSLFARRKLQLPAITAAPGPRPFDVVFALDRAFAFDPQKGGLLLEIVVYSQQPGSYDLDLGRQCTSVHQRFGRPGCKGSNGRIPVADCPTRALLAGGAFVMRVRDAIANAPIAIFVGTRETGPWLGLPLPWPLDGLGASGCTLNTDVALLIAAAAGPGGEARVPGLLPADERLVGLWFRFQAAALDRTANQLGMTFSNGSKSEICGPDPLGRVLATDLLSPRGQVEIGVSPVTRISLQ